MRTSPTAEKHVDFNILPRSMTTGRGFLSEPATSYELASIAVHRGPRHARRTLNPPPRPVQMFKRSTRTTACSLTYARFITIFPASAKRFSGGYPAFIICRVLLPSNAPGTGAERAF
jgi:hypothetical protein